MEYRFKSLFDREKEHVIETEEPLHLYNEFSISIRKVDKESKSFSVDNINCVLKYGKRGVTGINQIELDSTNYDGFHMMVEMLKKRGCLSMGEGVELVRETKPYEFKDTNLGNANNELKLAFNKYLEENKIMDILFFPLLIQFLYRTNEFSNTRLHRLLVLFDFIFRK